MADIWVALPVAGTALTNTTTETELGSVTLLEVGGSSGAQGKRLVRFDLLTRTTGASPGGGLTLRFKVAGTTVVTTGIVTQAASDVCAMHGSMVVRYDGTAIVQVWATDSDASGTLNPKLYTAVIATVGLGPTLSVTGEWSGADVANVVQLESFNVWDSYRG